MSKQRPAEQVAVGDRASLPHFVVGAKLVAENFIRCGIPIGLRRIAHGRLLLAEEAMGCRYCWRRGSQGEGRAGRAGDEAPSPATTIVASRNRSPHIKSLHHHDGALALATIYAHFGRMASSRLFWKLFAAIAGVNLL